MHLAGVHVRLALGDRGMRRMRGGVFAGLPRGVRGIAAGRSQEPQGVCWMAAAAGRSQDWQPRAAMGLGARASRP
jgi:hypothetical protein